MNETHTSLALRTSRNTLFGNVGLSLGKLIVGLLASSGALVSDAVHSFADVISTLIVIFSVKLAGKEADREHPYGHERLECVCGFILSAILTVTALLIGYRAIGNIREGGSTVIPGAAALIAAVVSIVVKELMYHYTMGTAKKLQSTALKAEAWHHRSDALSSIGSFAGILGARLGLPWADAAASLIICLFILKVAVDIFRESLNGVLDTSCDSATERRMQELILSQPGVLGLDLLNTRMFGNRIYVDVEIRADGSQSLESAHLIAETVHDAIEKNFRTVKHCMVHVNPGTEENRAPSDDRAPE